MMDKEDATKMFHLQGEMLNIYWRYGQNKEALECCDKMLALIEEGSEAYEYIKSKRDEIAGDTTDISEIERTFTEWSNQFQMMKYNDYINTEFKNFSSKARKCLVSHVIKKMKVRKIKISQPMEKMFFEQLITDKLLGSISKIDYNSSMNITFKMLLLKKKFERLIDNMIKKDFYMRKTPRKEYTEQQKAYLNLLADIEKELKKRLDNGKKF